MPGTEDVWIAYVGPFPFPWGSAGSRRICGMARTLAEIGFRVVVCSGEYGPEVPKDLGEGEVAGTVRYVGLGELPHKGAGVFRKSIQIFWRWGKRTVAWLESRPVKPVCVFVYGGSAQYILRLRPWCKRNGVPLVVDVVEWYDRRQFTGGTLGPFHISAKLALRVLYPRCDGVVAISRLLESHYRARVCAVVRIPPTVDVLGTIVADQNPTPNGRALTLIYAGTPGKKDLLVNMVKAVCAVDPNGMRLKLLVVGPSQEQVRSLICGDKLSPAVVVLGHVEQKIIARQIQLADFSVLLREPVHFTNAGFPTKVVESMACGTPVIANLTSDLEHYLHDGIEGLVCKDQTVDSLIVALQHALALSPEQREAMRRAARLRAEQSFDFRVYAASLADFLMSLPSPIVPPKLGLS